LVDILQSDPLVRKGGALVLIAAAVVVTLRIVHKSIATAMMGFMPFVYAVPLLSLALVAWAVSCRGLVERRRGVLLVVVILMACVPLTLVRSNGITGDGAAQFAWRWSRTPEQQLLAQSLEKTVAPSLAPVLKTPNQQPGSDASAKPRLTWPD
jgi:hypothetical protein